MELGFLWRTLTGTRPELELDGRVWFFREHLIQLTEAPGPKLPDTLQAYERAEEESRNALARVIERQRDWRRPEWSPFHRFSSSNRVGLLVWPPFWMAVGGVLVWLMIRG